MNREAVLTYLDELLEMPAGTLKGNEEIESWDSIVLLGLIALADERFDKRLSVNQLQTCKTANDVINVLFNN